MLSTEKQSGMLSTEKQSGMLSIEKQSGMLYTKKQSGILYTEKQSGIYQSQISSETRVAYIATLYGPSSNHTRIVCIYLAYWSYRNWVTHFEEPEWACFGRV